MPTITGNKRSDPWSAFIRRLAETQAMALAGDTTAKRILGQYGLLRWVGHRPEQALAIAELEVAQAESGR